MTRTARTVIALLMALVLPMGATTAAQAHGRQPQHHVWKVRVGNQSPNMAIQAMRFLPGSITINASDSVTWLANTAEIHTVTLLNGGKAQTPLPRFNPADPKQIKRQGGSAVLGSGYYNSGLLTVVKNGGDIGPFPPKLKHYQRYTLKFPHPGTYTYYCLVHGAMMVGTITVHKAGTPYPHTQAFYNQQAGARAHALLVRGVKLLRATRQASDGHHVMAGADDGTVAVMRFLRRVVTVHVGEQVTFLNKGMGAPHTVTFGTEPPPPGLFTPSGDPTNFTGGNLNSGIIEPGKSFTVTFKKAGTYRYVCALHDFMGMKGRVVVQP